MLKQRIITALVLAPLALLAILFMPIELFKYAVAGIILLGAYEWANMSGITARIFKGWFTVFIAVLLAIIIFSIDATEIWVDDKLNGLYLFILSVAALWWVISLFMIIAYPKYSGFWKNSRGIRAAFGVLTLIPTWVAILTLRTSGYDLFPYYGASLLFYVLGIVWAADIGAFFVGVKFGKHKLRIAWQNARRLIWRRNGVSCYHCLRRFPLWLY
jgi:phosphatidate cytidylyltransferase